MSLYEEMRARHEAEKKARSELVKDAMVCITGVGMDATLHTHERVLRVTKTMVVTANKSGEVSHRFGIDDGRSKPYTPYGGSDLNLTCKKSGGKK